MAASLSSGWTGLMKAGFSLRLEVFFLVFGMGRGTQKYNRLLSKAHSQS
jgi:hypothetical protein